MPLSPAEKGVLRHRRERAEGRHGTRERVDPNARQARMPAEVDALADRMNALEGRIQRLEREVRDITAERDRERMLRTELGERVADLQRRAAMPVPARRRG